MTTQRAPGAEAHINWTHIDGPLLVCSDGTLHWLTKIEKLWARLGFVSVTQLDTKHNQEPQRG